MDRISERTTIDPSESSSWRQFGVASGDDWFVYRLYDSADELLYVGITWNAFERWSQHRRSKPWWPEVSAASVTTVKGERTARAAETAAIHSERPRYNIHQVRRSDA